MAGRSATLRVMVLAVVILAAGCGGGEPNEPEPLPTYAVQVSPDSLGLVPGDTARLTAATTRNGVPASPPGLQWVSSAPDVATVDQSGKVTAVGEGTAMVGADVTAASAGAASDRILVRVQSAFVDAGTKVLDTVTVASDSTEAAAGTVRIAAGTAADYPAGTVLLRRDEANPLLKKVIGSTQSGGQVVLSVEDAALTDAYDELQWESATALSLVRGRVGGSGGPVLSPSAEPWLAPGVSVSDAGVISFDGSGLSVTFDVGQGKQVTAGVEVEGGFVTFEPTFRASARIGVGALEHLRVTAGGNFGFGAEKVKFNLSGTAVSSGTASGSTTLFESGKYKKTKRPLARFPFPPTCIGAVCYTVELGFDITLATTGTITGSLTSGGAVNTTIEAGLEFVNGQLQPVLTTGGGGHVDPVTVTLGGEIGIALTIEPSVFVKFFNVGGPYIGLPVTVDVKAGVDNWDWFVSSTTLLELALGGKVEVFGVTLAELRATFELLKHTERTDGRAAALTLPTSVAIAPGQAVQLAPSFTYLGFPLPPPPLRWVTGDPSIATVSATGLLTGVANGTVQVGAQLISNPAIQTISNVTVQQAQLSVAVSPAAATATRQSARSWLVTVMNGGAPVSGATVDIVNQIVPGTTAQLVTNGVGQATYQFSIPGSAPTGDRTLTFTARRAGLLDGIATAAIEVLGNLKLAVLPPNFQCPTTCPGNEDEVAGPYAPDITIQEWFDVATGAALTQPSPGSQRTFAVAVENRDQGGGEAGVQVDVADPFTGGTTTVTTVLTQGFGGFPVALYTFTVPQGTAPGTYFFTFGPTRKAGFAPTGTLRRGVIVVP